MDILHFKAALFAKAFSDMSVFLQKLEQMMFQFKLLQAQVFVRVWKQLLAKCVSVSTTIQTWQLDLFIYRL